MGEMIWAAFQMCGFLCGDCGPRLRGKTAARSWSRAGRSCHMRFGCCFEGREHVGATCVDKPPQNLPFAFCQAHFDLNSIQAENYRHFQSSSSSYFCVGFPPTNVWVFLGFPLKFGRVFLRFPLFNVCGCLCFLGDPLANRWGVLGFPFRNGWVLLGCPLTNGWVCLDFPFKQIGLRLSGVSSKNGRVFRGKNWQVFLGFLCKLAELSGVSSKNGWVFCCVLSTFARFSRVAFQTLE